MRFTSCARLLAIWALGSAALLSTFAAAEGASPGLRGATANITVVMDMAEAGNWTAPAGRNADKAGGFYTLSIQPGQENQEVFVGGPYTQGRVDLYVKSAAVSPGIITSAYLTNGGQARTGAGGGDGTPGSQDEIDLEWKGNAPSMVQTNVFLSGAENLQLVYLPGDSSAITQLYGLEWDDTKVVFYIDGVPVRLVPLARPLDPMSLHLSVWTTSGGWPGLVRWAGPPPDWTALGGAPVSATFNVIATP